MCSMTMCFSLSGADLQSYASQTMAGDSASCHRLISLLVDIVLWTQLSTGCFPSLSTGQIHNSFGCQRCPWTAAGCYGDH